MKRPLREVPSGCMWEDDGRYYIIKEKSFLGIPYKVKIWPTLSTFLKEGYGYFYFKDIHSGVIILPDGSFEFTGNRNNCIDEVYKDIIGKLSFKIYKMSDKILKHVKLPIKTKEFYFNISGKLDMCDGFIGNDTEDKLSFVLGDYNNITFSPKIPLEYELKAVKTILDKLSCYRKEIEMIEQKEEDLKKAQQMSIKRLLDNYEHSGCN